MIYFTFCLGNLCMYVYMYVCMSFGSLPTLVTEQTYFKWWQKKPRHPLTFVYVALNQSHVSPSLSSKLKQNKHLVTVVTESLIFLDPGLPSIEAEMGERKRLVREIVRKYGGKSTLSWVESQKSEKSKFWDVADWTGEERRRLDKRSTRQ